MRRLVVYYGFTRKFEAGGGWAAAEKAEGH